MDSGYITLKEELRGYAFKELFGDHYVALLNVSVCTLILGSPLMWNVLWHLKVRISLFCVRAEFRASPGKQSAAI